MINIPHCCIIYGYTENCLDNIQDSPVLLIEPRPYYIDIIKGITKTNKNIILISKILCNSKCTSEIPFFYHKQDDYYWIIEKEDDLKIKRNNLFDIKKYNVYPTNLIKIITDYSIQNVEKLIVNLNITNISNILDNVLSYNHIISEIIIQKDIQTNSKILSYYHSKDIDNKIHYIHKNLNINLPNIGLYFLNNIEQQYKKNVNIFVNQYKMNIILQKYNDNKIIYVPYPDSIQIIESKQIIKQSSIFYDHIITVLDGIFSNNDQNISDKLDIIIQFNPKYFSNTNTLQIMYPIKDNTIYVNKLYDIMYATKNCMFMLYQILKSKYFTDYIKQKRSEKPKLFKIFAKRYFYDYLSKIFVLQDF